MLHHAKLPSLAVSALAVTLGFTAITDADAADRIRWKMQSTWGSQVAINGESAVHFSDKIKSISDGNIQIRFHEPNALVPSLEVWDAVKNGAIDAGFTTPGYHAGKIPALSFFSAVPFGPGMGEYHAWMQYGGGNELKEEIYHEHGLHPITCLSHAPETSGWFREKLTSVDDLKGLKMRFFGLGAMVMNKLGVSTQLLAGGDIYPALEKGVIDATEFSMPTHDLSYGFYELAKFNYFPGWHQQTSMGELLLQKSKWDELSDVQKDQIQTACNDTVWWALVRSEAKQVPAMREMEGKGVTFVRWSDEDLAKFEKAWEEVVVEQTGKDPLFKRIYDNYRTFRDEYAIWRENAYLN